MQMPNTPLQPVDEDWTTALAIVAHPDDLEFGAASAIARWTKQGKHVVYLLATRGEAGIDGMTPEEAGPLREQEERDSAEIVGVEEVEFLDYPDGVLEYGLPLRHDFAAAVRRHQPEVVITGNYQDTFGPGMLNQADHIAVGRAVIDAVRDAGNRWVFRDLLQQGLEPWGGVHTVLVSGSPKGQHAVNIDDDLADGIRSLEAHAQYMSGLGGNWPPIDEFLESMARMFGPRLGCTFATPFEVISLRPPEF
jgi:LmbE family N-acetylglucosaminyl deacetylase